jgi:hypothetical protein
MSGFPFDEGDTVLVRARENGTRGTIEAKFEAVCEEIVEGRGFGSPKARFEMPFGRMNMVDIRPYEAEFEVIE